MFKSKLIAFFTIVACSQGAHCDEQPGNRWLLAKYDVNGDRIISAGEIENKRQRVFANMDENADGDVSFNEYRKLDHRKRDAILNARFAKLDADNDGRLTGEEYASYLGSFERLDQNGDGVVSPGEMAPTNESRASLKPQADACLLWVCVRKSIK